MMNIMRFFTLSLLIYLSSCASVSNQDLTQLFDPIPLNGSVERAFASTDFEQGAWPESNWWISFGDPQLNALIELGLKENLTLKKAEARLELFNQIAKKEKARLFPHLSADYLETWQHLSKNGFDRSFFPLPSNSTVVIPNQVNQIDLTLNFSYELDFWGKNRNLFQAALGNAKAMKAEAAQAKLLITTQIAQSYIQLQSLLDQSMIVQEQLEERLDLYKLASSRQKKGISSLSSVLEAQRQIDAVEQLKLLLEQAILIQKNLLKTLTGQGPDAPDLELPMTAFFNRAFPLPENLSIDLLSRRPDLQVQIWRTESAAKEIGAAKADFYPNVNLLALAGLESLSFGELFKISSKTGGLSPAIHLPIFMGGALRSNLKAKVAQFNEAALSYNELLLQASQEVSDKLMILQTHNREVAVQKRTLNTVMDEYQLIQSRFDHGINTYLSVLKSQEEVLDQSFLLTGMQRDYLLSVLQLIKSLGGGYIHD